MSSSEGWSNASVAELQAAGILLVEDGNHGEYRPRRFEFVPDGVAFIRAADMENGRILFESASRINETALARIRKGIGAQGDVLLSHKGTVGKVATAPPDCEPFVCSPQTTFWRVLDELTLDRRYLHYFMTSDVFHHQLDARKAETDMAEYVSLTSQRTLQITFPPIARQRAIANVLGSLDDKIGLNRRMSRTLEAIARALFKSWFVDFDPVRAKTEGRPPIVPAELADHFPGRFVESPIGPVPEGWGVAPLGDVARNHRRLIKPSELEEYQVYVGLEHVPRRSLALWKWSSTEGLSSAKFSFKPREILFGKLRPYFHKVVPAPTEGVCSTDVLVVGPTEEKWWGFVLGHMTSDELVRFADAASSGTKMPRTNWKDLARYQIAMPPEGLAGAFTSIVQPLVDRILLSTLESRTLAETRDWLLPRLVSGRVRVRDRVSSATQATE